MLPTNEEYPGNAGTAARPSMPSAEVVDPRTVSGEFTESEEGNSSELITSDMAPHSGQGGRIRGFFGAPGHRPITADNLYVVQLLEPYHR